MYILEIIGIFIAFLVMFGGFVVWRDKKIEKTTIQNISIDIVSKDVKEIRDDVKGFKSMNDSIKEDVRELCGKVDTVKDSVKKAHERIDDLLTIRGE